LKDKKRGGGGLEQGKNSNAVASVARDSKEEGDGAQSCVWEARMGVGLRNPSARGWKKGEKKGTGQQGNGVIPLV